jgi:hypothetical protein
MNLRQALMVIQMEFVEMPELKLTLQQAGRLWTLPADACHVALSALVESGFLIRTKDGSYVRRGTPPVNVDAFDARTWGDRTPPAC